MNIEELKKYSFITLHDDQPVLLAEQFLTQIAGYKNTRRNLSNILKRVQSKNKIKLSMKIDIFRNRANPKTFLSKDGCIEIIRYRENQSFRFRSEIFEYFNIKPSDKTLKRFADSEKRYKELNLQYDSDDSSDE